MDLCICYMLAEVHLPSCSTIHTCLTVFRKVTWIHTKVLVLWPRDSLVDKYFFLFWRCERERWDMCTYSCFSFSFIYLFIYLFIIIFLVFSVVYLGHGSGPKKDQEK